MKKTVCLALVCLIILSVPFMAMGEAAEHVAYGFHGDETVAPAVLCDEGGFKVSATGLAYIAFAPVLMLEAENTSGAPITFDLVESALNSWMWDASLCTYEDNEGDDNDMLNETGELSVGDGETLAFGLDFSNGYYYEPCGIAGVGEISFVLRAFDPDSGDTLFITPTLDVETSLGSDYPGLYVDTGSLAYEADGVRVVIAGVKNDFGSPSVVVYANNSSDKPVLITAEDCKVNGTAAEAWFSAQVSPGRQCLADMGFDGEFTDIDTLALVIRVDAYAPFVDDEPTLIGASEPLEFSF